VAYAVELLHRLLNAASRECSGEVRDVQVTVTHVLWWTERRPTYGTRAFNKTVAYRLQGCRLWQASFERH